MAQQLEYVSNIIAGMGGVSALAKRLGVNKAAVYAWKRNGIPKGWFAYMMVKYPDVINAAGGRNE